MSKEYKQETIRNYEKHIESQLSEAPQYVKAFYNHMHNGRREITTQSAYIRDVLIFLKYLCSVINELQNMAINQFPIEILSRINEKDIESYRAYLCHERNISNSSAKKRLAAVSAFYKYLNLDGYIENNPMANFEYPVVNSHRIIKLDANLSKQLLDGILRNDKYLLSDGEKTFPVDITNEIRYKREKTVLRNYAICYLFLGTGLRVSELVGLDVSDVNFTQKCVNVILKGGDETQVYFSDEVAIAIHEYLTGDIEHEHLYIKYREQENLLQWCKNHTGDLNFDTNLKKAFPDIDENTQSDMKTMVRSMNRSGRRNLLGDKNSKALFISYQGRRLTVRMVELMIKEMVRTYLPEYDDKDLFSPHKLRATCATRILMQTGNIELASTQLNHKSVAVTAAFYAELQKEKRKEEVRKLDVNDW